MTQPTTEPRRFASPCVIASSEKSRLTQRELVPVPVTNCVSAVDSQIQLVQIGGVVQEIILRCSCEREHRIRLDYATPAVAQENTHVPN